MFSTSMGMQCKCGTNTDSFIQNEIRIEITVVHFEMIFVDLDQHEIDLRLRIYI